MSTVALTDVQPLGAREEQPSPDAVFDPRAHFDDWWAAIETFRNRLPARLDTAVLLNGYDIDFEGGFRLDDQLGEKLEAPGTLVIAQHGKLEGQVDVTHAVIDGVFKGNITASESVVVENHAIIMGDIHTPSLTIRGGAIIEGKCDFGSPKEKWGPPVWSALKGSLAKVWRGRIFQ